MSQLRDQGLLKKIALILKALREERNLTQEEVYNDTQIHIARIETGNVNLSISTLSFICTYNKTSLLEVFSSSDFQIRK